MKPLAHIAASGIISIAVGIYFKSIGCAAISLAAGVLVDADHFIDYYTSHPFTIRIKYIYNACEEIRIKKLYVILHSYELVLILWLAIFALSLSDYWKAAAIGLTQHILFDQFTNPIGRLGYFVIYRMIRGFKKELLVTLKD
ncbi:MAG: hypothetical protein NC938_00625 [Candidatus Omnitrophica bacterium]|nr:hypothetical protein [Candidatus Omnitrophota bacterium]MCM8790193.1 hypothetical protein [Candidatus Omnitrophota bacterium]